MQKLLFIITVILCGASLTDVFAAASNAPTTIGGVAVPTAPDSSQVMSKDAFKGTVDTLGKETTQHLNDTVQQQIKASSSGAPTQSPAGSSTNTSTPAVTPSTETGSSSTNQPNNSDNNTTQPANNSDTGTKPISTSTQQSSQTPSSSDSYTGFGSSQTQQKSGNTGNGNSGSGKSGGWNVGY